MRTEKEWLHPAWDLEASARPRDVYVWRMARGGKTDPRYRTGRVSG